MVVWHNMAEKVFEYRFMMFHFKNMITRVSNMSYKNDPSVGGSNSQVIMEN